MKEYLDGCGYVLDPLGSDDDASYVSGDKSLRFEFISDVLRCIDFSGIDVAYRRYNLGYYLNGLRLMRIAGLSGDMIKVLNIHRSRFNRRIGSSYDLDRAEKAFVNSLRSALVVIKNQM